VLDALVLDAPPVLLAVEPPRVPAPLPLVSPLPPVSKPTVPPSTMQKPRAEHTASAKQHELSSAHHWVSSMTGTQEFWQVNDWTSPSNSAAQIAPDTQSPESMQGPPAGLPSLPGSGHSLSHPPGGGGSSM